MVRGTTELQRPVPLSMQVVRQLRAQIASGELAEGERIPSQREMMQIWRISMQTASKVIGALKTEGLAIPSIGRDTVGAPAPATRIAATAAGTAQVPAPPEPPGNDVKAEAAMTAAPADVAEILGIPSGRRALRRQETHLDKTTPVSVSDTWFPPAVTAEAPLLTENKPLPAGALAYIAEAAEQRVTRAVEERAALPADTDAARALNVQPDLPVLVTKTSYYGAADQIIAYSESTVPAGNWRVLSYSVTGTR